MWERWEGALRRWQDLLWCASLLVVPATILVTAVLLAAPTTGLVTGSSTNATADDSGYNVEEIADLGEGTIVAVHRMDDGRFLIAAETSDSRLTFRAYETDGTLLWETDATHDDEIRESVASIVRVSDERYGVALYVQSAPSRSDTYAARYVEIAANGEIVRDQIGYTDSPSMTVISDVTRLPDGTAYAVGSFVPGAAFDLPRVPALAVRFPPDGDPRTAIVGGQRTHSLRIVSPAPDGDGAIALLRRYSGEGANGEWIHQVVRLDEEGVERGVETGNYDRMNAENGYIGVVLSKGDATTTSALVPAASSEENVDTPGFAIVNESLGLEEYVLLPDLSSSRPNYNITRSGVTDIVPLDEADSFVVTGETRYVEEYQRYFDGHFSEIEQIPHGWVAVVRNGDVESVVFHERGLRPLGVVDMAGQQYTVVVSDRESNRGRLYRIHPNTSDSDDRVGESSDDSLAQSEVQTTRTPRDDDQNTGVAGHGFGILAVLLALVALAGATANRL